MRKLLRSKLTVGCLAATAIICITANFVELPTRRPLSISARPAPGSSGKVAEHYSVPPPLQAMVNLGAWEQLFPDRELTRDPFALGALRRTVGGLAASDFSAASEFRLQGISIDGDRALAVMNRRVLAVGETIGDYTVEQILPTEVHLRNPQGLVIVTFARPLPSPSAPVPPGSKDSRIERAITPPSSSR